MLVRPLRRIRFVLLQLSHISPSAWEITSYRLNIILTLTTEPRSASSQFQDTGVAPVNWSLLSLKLNLNPQTVISIEGSCLLRSSQEVTWGTNSFLLSLSPTCQLLFSSNHNQTPTHLEPITGELSLLSLWRRVTHLHLFTTSPVDACPSSISLWSEASFSWRRPNLRLRLSAPPPPVSQLRGGSLHPTASHGDLLPAEV